MTVTIAEVISKEQRLTATDPMAHSNYWKV
jgi:hypothetical protein